jgi:hypothetical protein
MNGRPSLDPSGGRGARTALHVEVTRGIEGYSAVIRALGARTGERYLSDLGPDCRNLADALALTLAIILDNEADRASIEPEHRTGVDTRSNALLDDERKHRVTESSLELGAALGVHAGALPVAGALVSVQGRFWPSDVFALSAGGFWALDQTEPYEARPPGQLELELASAFAGACVRVTPQDAAPRVALCAEPYVGRLQGTGVGFDEDQPPQTHVWLAGGLAIDAVGRLTGPLHWQIKASGLVMREHRFFVSLNGQPDTVFKSSPAALFASAGLVLVI